MHHARRFALAGLAAWGASVASCGSPTGADGAETAVASVTIDPPSSTLVVGGTVPLAALVEDASGRPAPDLPVVWSVRDAEVAAISQTGVVTALGVGSTQVAASVNGVSAIASVTVRLPPVASLLIEPEARTLRPGETASFAATPRDGDGRALTGRVVAWTSSNGAIASVTPTGLVTAVAVGAATITATSEGVSANAVVTVLPVPVKSVSIAPSSTTVSVGETAVLVATVKDANDLTVTDRVVAWSSSDERVAVVSAGGIVRGVAPGTAIITAASEGKPATATVTVRPAVSFVLVSPSLVLVRKSGTVQLSAAAYDVNNARIFGRTVTWSSDDESVATVDANGLVKTKKAGAVLITATIDGKSDSALVTVTN